MKVPRAPARGPPATCSRAALAPQHQHGVPELVAEEAARLGELPDPIPGMEIDRMELPPGAHMTGIPHTPGTREYLACEAGAIVLAVAGERFELRAGDVVAFRGDQRHSYHNPGARPAIGYSVVALARVR